MQSKIFLLSLTMFVLVLASCTKKDDLQNVQDETLSIPPVISNLSGASFNGKYIVVMKPEAGLATFDVKGKKDHVKGKALGLLKKYEVPGDVEEVYETALQGFVMEMTPEQAANLLKDPEVKAVEADQLVTISGRKSKPAPSPGTTTPTTTQNTPWGITRVGGGATYTGTNVVWVIDSGIDLTHPDLNVDKVRGVSFVTGNSSPNDDYGHGTHVAGTIAAINNSIGVVGVAAGATVVPVKVLDSTGYGYFSAVLSGVNYVMANGKPGDVVNMSTSGGESPTLDDAVIKASAVLKFALAAGNNSDYAYKFSPGGNNGPNIYTVTAMSSGDLWASFSNFGNNYVDYCAPGVSIYSTFKSGSYASMSGTSMAAPHMAGLLLLGSIATSGYVNNDPDGTPDPIAHK